MIHQHVYGEFCLAVEDLLNHFLRSIPKFKQEVIDNAFMIIVFVHRTPQLFQFRRKEKSIHFINVYIFPT